MTALRTAERIAAFLALVFAVANATLYWSRRAPAPVSSAELAWRALPDERRRKMIELLDEDRLGSDQTALRAARRFNGMAPDSRERLRQLYSHYASLVATQPLSWRRLFEHADPPLRASLVHRALHDDPQALKNVEELYRKP